MNKNHKLALSIFKKIISLRNHHSNYGIDPRSPCILKATIDECMWLKDNGYRMRYAEYTNKPDTQPDNTITHNGVVIYVITPKYAERKVNGCYKILMPKIEGNTPITK
jgi:hypothetical protein